MSLSIRKIFLRHSLRYTVIGLLMLLSFPGCNTRIEGCLDANAENFDLNAERPCDGCCTYPSMALSLTQKWADRNYANTDTLYDINTQPYKIQDLKYFLTSWSWKDPEGGLYTVDSLEADCGEDVLRYTPDNLVVDTRQFSYTLGSIRKSPRIDSLQFVLGLTLDYSCLDADDPDTPANLTDQSPLWNTQSSTLATIRLIVQRNLETEIFDTIFIVTQLDLHLEYIDQIAPGMDTQLKLTVNYAQWFQDVDITELSSFTTSILNHFTGSISPTL